MIYPYHCSQCDKEFEVYKSMNEAARPELCETCSTSMDRVWTRTLLIGEKVYEANYNPAFGKVIHSKRDLANTISEINDKKGVKLVEVGNDKLDSIKPTRKEYTLD